MNNRFCAAFLLLFAFTMGSILGIHSPILAALGENTTTVTHTPVHSVNSGKRLFLSVTASDPNRIDAVRIYFKAQENPHYNFISLRNEVRSKYIGSLPAAAPECKTFDYFILIKNGKNNITISNTYTVEVIDSKITVPPSPNRVHTYSEFTDAPEKIPGFFDNFTLTVVQPSLRYGAVAGVYGEKKIDTDLRFSGRISVPAPSGISKTTLTAGGATVFSIAIGGFAIHSGSSSDASLPESDNYACSYQGNWSGTWQEIRCGYLRTSGSWSGTVDDNCYFTSNKGGLHGQIEPDTGEAPALDGSQIISCNTVGRLVHNTSSRAIFDDNQVGGSYTAEQISGTFTGIKR